MSLKPLYNTATWHASLGESRRHSPPSSSLPPPSPSPSTEQSERKSSSSFRSAPRHAVSCCAVPCSVVSRSNCARQDFLGRATSKGTRQTREQEPGRKRSDGIVWEKKHEKNSRTIHTGVQLRKSPAPLSFSSPRSVFCPARIWMRSTTRSSSAPVWRSASSRACSPSAANGCCTSTATSTTAASRPPSRPSRTCSGGYSSCLRLTPLLFIFSPSSSAKYSANFRELWKEDVSNAILQKVR